MCRLHVCHRVGPLINYKSTAECSNKDARRKVFALDCEMCYTTQGLELTRLTIVDFELEQMVDLFVKPANPIGGSLILSVENLWAPYFLAS